MRSEWQAFCHFNYWLIGIYDLVNQTRHFMVKSIICRIQVHCLCGMRAHLGIYFIFFACVFAERLEYQAINHTQSSKQSKCQKCPQIWTRISILPDGLFYFTRLTMFLKMSSMQSLFCCHKWRFTTDVNPGRIVDLGLRVVNNGQLHPIWIEEIVSIQVGENN